MIIKKFKPCEKQFDDGLVIKNQTKIKINAYQQHKITLPYTILYLPQSSVATIHLSQYLKDLCVIIYPSYISKPTQIMQICLKNMKNHPVQIKEEAQLGYLICVSYQPIKTISQHSFHLKNQNSLSKCFTTFRIEIKRNRSLVLSCEQDINYNQMIFNGVDENKIKSFINKDKIIICNNHDQTIVLEQNSFIGHFISKHGLNISFVQ